MTDIVPIGQRLATLAWPPVAMCLSIASMTLSGWGKGDFSLVGILFFGGFIGVLIAVLGSIVVYPTAIYHLVKYPELRTGLRVAIVATGSMLAVFVIRILSFGPMG